MRGEIGKGIKSREGPQKGGGEGSRQGQKGKGSG